MNIMSKILLGVVVFCLAVIFGYAALVKIAQWYATK